MKNENGIEKSAILKGQTLVNVYDYTSSTFVGGATIENGVVTFKTNGGWVVINNKLPMLKPNTNYTIFVNILSNTLTYSSSSDNYALRVEGDTGNSGFITGFDIPKGSVGIFKKLLTTKESLSTTNLSDVRVSASANGGEIKFTYMIIEGDHSNEDIPYFEGIQSVKMPVLTTTGKNFMSSEMELGNFNSNNGSLSDNAAWQRSSDFIALKSNTQYQLNDTTCGKWFLFYDKNKNFIGSVFARNGQFTTPYNCAYLKFAAETSDLSYKWQIELGNTITEYEPYKTNILTVNEEVELRGIGDVKDTIDCLTGEYTKAIYEYTFTGDEAWSIVGGNSGGYSYFTCNSSQLPVKFDYGNGANVPVICDRLPKIDYTDFDKRLKSVGINLTYGVRLNFRDCNSNDGATVEDLKAYLKANPTTVQYPISKTIKTVDLTIKDQDGNAMPCLSTFNDATHVSINAVDIIPQVDLEVRVDANTMANVASQQDDLAVAQASLSDAIDAQNDDIEMTKQALDEVKGE